MDRILIRYEGNDSTRYDGKEYFESISKIHRRNASSGSLRVGEEVTVKTKSRIWKAVVVDCTPPEPSAKRRRTKSQQSVTESPIILDQSSESTLPAALPSFVVTSFAPSRRNNSLLRKITDNHSHDTRRDTKAVKEHTQAKTSRSCKQLISANF